MNFIANFASFFVQQKGDVNKRGVLWYSVLWTSLTKH